MNWRKSDSVVGIVGDFCLDKDYLGSFSGVLSREKEDMRIFDVSCADIHCSGGGAANIVDQLTAWDVRVIPCGIWDPVNDINSRILNDLWADEFVNTRYMVRGIGIPAYVKYYDKEGEHYWRANESILGSYPRKKLLEKLEQIAEVVDIMIVADYNEDGSGIVDNQVIELVRESCSVPVIGLSRQRITRFNGFNILVMNEKELAEATDPELEVDHYERAVNLFLETRAMFIIITMEEKGACIYSWPGKRDTEEDSVIIEHVLIPSRQSKGRINTCGCGDSFIAAMATCLASGMDIVEAVKYGNAAARVQTRLMGGARTLSRTDWEAEYEVIYGGI